MFKLITFLITLLFLAIGIILGVLNPGSIELNLFFFQASLPLSLVLAMVFVLGALLGGLVLLIEVARLKWRLSIQVKKNRKQLDQIVQLKKKNINEQQALTSSSNALIQMKKVGK